MNSSLVLAVDFDGTVVVDRYPEIGKPMPFAFEALRKLAQDGHRIVLWTYRAGKPLDEAVAFMKKQGIDLYAVNESFPGEKVDFVRTSRKIHADFFIDDRIVGGFPGWGTVYQHISGMSFDEPAPRDWRFWRK